MNSSVPTRDELVSGYLDQLPFEPYPIQEEALLAWFGSDEGVLVCTPTGTGKTLIAEAAVYEGLATGRRAAPAGSRRFVQAIDRGGGGVEADD